METLSHPASLSADAPDVAIVRDPRRCGGDPILAGTRTAVHDVVSYAALYGGDLDRVREDALPHLTRQQIEAALAWYAEHREEIDGILRQRRADYEGRRPAREEAA